MQAMVTQESRFPEKGPPSLPHAVYEGRGLRFTLEEGAVHVSYTLSIILHNCTLNLVGTFIVLVAMHQVNRQ